MNREQVQQRMIELDMQMSHTQGQLNQIAANLNALQGAKQELEQWLIKIAEKESQDTEAQAEKEKQEAEAQAAGQ